MSSLTVLYLRNCKDVRLNVMASKGICAYQGKMTLDVQKIYRTLHTVEMMKLCMTLKEDLLRWLVYIFLCFIIPTTEYNPTSHKPSSIPMFMLSFAKPDDGQLERWLVVNVEKWENHAHFQMPKVKISHILFLYHSILVCWGGLLFKWIFSAGIFWRLKWHQKKKFW